MKEKKEIQEEIKEIAKQLYPTWDWDLSFLYEILIRIPSESFFRLYQDLARILNLITLREPGLITSEEMDLLGKKVGLTRKPGEKAKGKVYFMTRILPTTPILIPKGTILSTIRTAIKPEKLFQTLHDTFLSPFSPYSLRYALFYTEAEIEAIEEGEDYNVDSEEITLLKADIRGVDRVVNPLPTSGGKDREEDIAFFERIIEKIKAPTFLTKEGLRNYILEKFTIKDCKIFYQRAFFSDPTINPVEIFILTRPADWNSQIDLLPSYKRELVFYKQPFRKLLRISGIFKGAERELQEDEFQIILDEKGWAFSAHANDKIIISPKEEPDSGTEFKIIYLFDEMLSKIEEEIERIEILGLSYIFRYSPAVPVNLTVKVKTEVGITIDDVKGAIIEIISKYFDQLKIGDSFDKEEIISDLYRIEGIKKIDVLPEKVVPKEYEHLVLDNISVVLWI